MSWQCHNPVNGSQLYKIRRTVCLTVFLRRYFIDVIIMILLAGMEDK